VWIGAVNEKLIVHLVGNKILRNFIKSKFIVAVISAFHTLLRLSLFIVNNFSQTEDADVVPLNLVISA